MLSENLLLQDHAMMVNIMSSMPGLVAVVRQDDLQLLYINELFERYFGYTSEEVNSGAVSFASLTGEDGRERIIYQLKEVADLPNRHTWYVIYKLKSKSGVESIYYLFASPVKGATGASGQIYCLVLQPNLSAWRMPFVSFDSREVFFEQFQNEDFGTFEWLMDADKVYWSEGVYRIYEVDERTADVNRYFARSFVHSGDMERVVENTRIALERDGRIEIEFKIVTAKRNIKTVHSLARIIRDKDGRSVKLIGSIRDITDKRNIEEDLRRKVEELNRSNEELEEFAYVASHDMQEPLRKITTFSSRLVEKYKDLLTGDGIMYLSRMTASAENMRTLINDLLEFSRISNTQLPFERISLNVLLKQVTSDLELRIEETGTVIKSDSLPVIEAIPSQIKQLFTNIINNAIKFHKEDVLPEIVVKSEELDKEDLLAFNLDRNRSYIRISIADNGIGFEEEYALRIFNVFQRLHGKSEYPGSGIGLAICKKIIDQHGGTIYAVGKPGAGAVFYFILPTHKTNSP